MPGVPVPLSALAMARPMYREFEGWQVSLEGCTAFEELPKAARSYVAGIEESLGRRIRYISVGPERNQLIDRGAV